MLRRAEVEEAGLQGPAEPAVPADQDDEVQGRDRPGKPHRKAGREHHLPEVSQRSEEHTSELQSRENLVCRLLLEKKKKNNTKHTQKHKDDNNNRKKTLHATNQQNPRLKGAKEE